MSDNNAYATYGSIRRGYVIENNTGERGTIEDAVFDMVLINWHEINPRPHPPIYYPSDVWDFRFGSNFFVVER